MSRIGKKPIEIPDKIEVKKEGNTIVVKGPLGELERNFKSDIDISIGDKEIVLNPAKKTKQAIALWGTYASHINNMIKGVSKGFEKNLVLEGVGFKVQMEGKNLVLSLGFSHPVKVSVPDGLKVEVEKNVIKVSGPDKEEVGAFSAKIRSLKKPEPYKGKGIRYEGEQIIRKAGKKAVAGAA